MKKIHRLKWVNIGNQVIAITVLSILMGLVIGTIDTIFGRTLIFLSEVRILHSLYLIPFLAFAACTNLNDVGAVNNLKSNDLSL